MQEEVLYIDVHADGTATATVDGKTETFPDYVKAGEWAEKIRWEGKNDGRETYVCQDNH